MRTGWFSFAAPAATALLFSSVALLPVRQAVTEEVRPAPPPCTCPNPQQAPSASPRPKFAAHELDDGDEAAALDAVGVALNEVGDGASFVWHQQRPAQRHGAADLLIQRCRRPHLPPPRGDAVHRDAGRSQGRHRLPARGWPLAARGVILTNP
jgi:hypothetical protein